MTYARTRIIRLLLFAAAVASTALLETLFWLATARSTVVTVVPVATRDMLRLAESHVREHKLTASGHLHHINLVVSPALERDLGPRGMARLHESVAGYDVALFTTSTAPAGFLADKNICRDCLVLDYAVKSTNPLFARVELSTWCGGLCGNGFSVTALHVF